MGLRGNRSTLSNLYRWEVAAGQLEVGRGPLWVMCGRLPVGKGLCDVDASWSGAVMCSAC